MQREEETKDRDKDRLSYSLTEENMQRHKNRDRKSECKKQIKKQANKGKGRDKETKKISTGKDKELEGHLVADSELHLSWVSRGNGCCGCSYCGILSRIH